MTIKKIGIEFEKVYEHQQIEMLRAKQNELIDLINKQQNQINLLLEAHPRLQERLNAIKEEENKSKLKVS